MEEQCSFQDVAHTMGLNGRYLLLLLLLDPCPVRSGSRPSVATRRPKVHTSIIIILCSRKDHARALMLGGSVCRIFQERRTGLGAFGRRERGGQRYASIGEVKTGRKKFQDTKRDVCQRCIYINADRQRIRRSIILYILLFLCLSLGVNSNWIANTRRGLLNLVLAALDLSSLGIPCA